MYNQVIFTNWTLTITQIKKQIITSIRESPSSYYLPSVLTGNHNLDF